MVTKVVTLRDRIDIEGYSMSMNGDDLAGGGMGMDVTVRLKEGGGNEVKFDLSSGENSGDTSLYLELSGDSMKELYKIFSEVEENTKVDILARKKRVGSSDVGP